jgi:ribosome biogenesis GTPase
LDDARVLHGTILRATSGFYSVLTDRGLVDAQLRGRLKKDRAATDLAVIGDRVRVTLLPDGAGIIEEIEPRRSRFSRRKPDPSGHDRPWREDVLLANLDQVLVVFACADPPPHVRMIDRFLVAAEHSNVEAVIVANKVDLVGAERAEELFGGYARIGYVICYTSAKAETGIDAFRDRLRGRISVVTGPSGVGKSTMLNAIQPGLRLATTEVGRGRAMGRHTTVTAELIPLAGEGSGYVADTPGLREIGLWDIPAKELDWCYREFRPYLGECAFRDCAHLSEPRCAVREGVESGAISAARYDSYRRLRADEGG